MAERQYTFEEIDKLVRETDLAGAERGLSAEALRADPQAIIGQICPTYRIIRPILQGLLNFPIPESWKQAIRAFIRVMDLLCPQQ